MRSAVGQQLAQATVGPGPYRGRCGGGRQVLQTGAAAPCRLGRRPPRSGDRPGSVGEGRATVSWSAWSQWRASGRAFARSRGSRSGKTRSRGTPRCRPECRGGDDSNPNGRPVSWGGGFVLVCCWAAARADVREAPGLEAGEQWSEYDTRRAMGRAAGWRSGGGGRRRKCSRFWSRGRSSGSSNGGSSGRRCNRLHDRINLRLCHLHLFQNLLHLVRRHLFQFVQR